jgi:hypothetical protein
MQWRKNGGLVAGRSQGPPVLSREGIPPLAETERRGTQDTWRRCGLLNDQQAVGGSSAEPSLVPRVSSVRTNRIIG